LRSLFLDCLFVRDLWDVVSSTLVFGSLEGGDVELVNYSGSVSLAGWHCFHSLGSIVASQSYNISGTSVCFDEALALV